MRGGRCLLTTLAAFALVPATASAAVTLQPGARSRSGDGACTLNFLFTNGKADYLGTAAHCVKAVGDPVRDDDGVAFGEVAMIGAAENTINDWAFIKVKTSELDRVSPRMKGSEQYPTGIATPEETRTGDVLQLSGYGLAFDLTPITRERRVGVLIFDEAYGYKTVAPLLFGDSGGPLVHARTGKALGIVSRLCVGLCTEEGPTIPGILRQAKARGLDLELVTDATQPRRLARAAASRQQRRSRARKPRSGSSHRGSRREKARRTRSDRTPR